MLVASFAISSLNLTCFKIQRGNKSRRLPVYTYTLPLNVAGPCKQFPLNLEFKQTSACFFWLYSAVLILGECLNLGCKTNVGKDRSTRWLGLVQGQSCLAILLLESLRTSSGAFTS